MKKEVSIGIFAAITLAVAVWGYKFLLGTNLLKNNKTYTTNLKNVDGLAVSDHVTFRGLVVGTVTKVAPNDDFSSMVVSLLIDNEDFPVPTNITANLAGEIMGSRSIRLVCDGNCNTETLPDKSIIPGRSLGLLGSLINKQELTEYMDIVEDGVGGIVDSLSAGFSNDSSQINSAIQDLRSTAVYLKSSTYHLSNLLKASSANIESSMANLSSITGNIVNHNEQIAAMLENLAGFSSKLNSTGMDSTLAATSALIDKTNNALNGVKDILDNLGTTAEKLNSSNNSVGALLSDRTFYDNLNQTNEELQLLLEDIRLHPKRYFRILSKKEIPYSAEEEKNSEKKKNADSSAASQ